jgi:subtilisin family serine protease
MSADPVGQLLGGAIEQHSEMDSAGGPPAMVHHHDYDADFWIDSWSERDIEAQLGEIEQTLASAHGSTGLTQVRNEYGFIGSGQTVAIIDSGIAWDHYALGGGFGSNYRVVGGWDFTEENDAAPYDDGPSGSHGTHVAGIVGADRTGTSDDGVAPGVDLVSLRVFNDAGDGYFNWVESALRWVHTNRNSFENPITTVNLSLGAAWNSTSLPAWAVLEDEFAQLEADGIFIAVSAGNAFSQYNTPGLAYPAASPYVVPVMSVRDNGTFSTFSQRHPSAIAAPGQYIVSTVPDYVGNQNGITDDYASFSGTSMAAPYVAGASALLREAMQFVGYTGITQDVIFNHMMSTATTFFDSVTGLNYKRLNMASALDALMPDDDYGSSALTAYSLGALSGTSEISGLIGTLSDADYFTFTAAATGSVSFTATATHGLAPSWSGAGGVVSGEQGETFTFDVVAGQSYTAGLSTSGGIGYYDLAIEAQSAFTYTDWGTIAQSRINDMANSGEKWYRVQASRAGYLTAEALFSDAAGNVDLAWYDANLQQVAVGIAGADSERVEVVANAGDALYLRVTGNNSDIDVRLTNLVSATGSTVSVAGTGSADVFSFTAGATHRLVVNGVTYSFAGSVYNTFEFTGGSGSDSITMTGTAGAETGTLRVGDAILAGSGFSARAVGVENVTLCGGGGADQAVFYDSSGDDNYVARSDRGVMSGNGYNHDARGFGRTTAYATAGGNDRAVFYDTVGDDTYVARANRGVMSGTGYYNDGSGFDRTTAYVTAGGYDRAIFYDTIGDDLYVAWPDRAVMCGSGYYNDARGFDRTNAYSTAGGNDRAEFYDSAGDDNYVAWCDRAVLYGSGYYNDARGFRRMTAYATAGGYDKAVLYDSTGDDSVVARAWGAYVEGGGSYKEARGFDEISAQLVLGGTNETDIESTDYLFNLAGQWS